MSNETESGFVSGIVETVKTVVYALLIAGVFRTLFFQPFWIPSGSMKSTLLVGDFLFVNKMAYGYSYASCPSLRLPALGIDIDSTDICGAFEDRETRLFGSEPERGDVVVFRHPVSGRDFIKRVVGMPGDTVQMRDGVLILNGEPVPQVPAGTFTEAYAPQGPERSRPACQNRPEIGGDCEKEELIETLPGGVAHRILNLGDGPLDNTGVFTVPEGHFFFMGDNRDNSSDSRVPRTSSGVGFVPLSALIGRADRVIFSSGGSSMLAFWTWRSDRFLETIE